MPGDNCCIPNCGVNRRCKGVGLFKLPSKEKQHFAEWRKSWLSAILKVRELDDDMKRQLENDSLHTCDRHFHPYEIETCKLNLFS